MNNAALARAGLLLAALSSAAAPAAAGLRPIRFDRFTVEQGLSQATVMDIHQDRRGYVWLATEDGLNRFDGLSFKVYRHDLADPASLPSSFVWDIEEDAAGNLWIGTNGGLARLDRSTGEVARVSSVSGVYVRVLHYVERDGTLWIGTRDSGVLRLTVATGAVRRFAHEAAVPQSLGDNRVYAFAVDGRGRLWVGTEGGLFRLEAGGNAFVRVGAAVLDGASLSSQRIRAILEDHAGVLWVGTADGGLNRLDPETGTIDHFRNDPHVPASLAHDHVRALLQDGEGRLWVGTLQGLELFDPTLDTFTHYRHDPRQPTGLGDDYVMSLAFDRSGVLWVGTRVGGVHKWNPRSWQFGHVTADPGQPGGLGSGHVTSFSEDRPGRLWVGTFDAGLYLVDRVSGRATAYRHDPKDSRTIPSDKVMSLRHDRRGDLWIGTLDAGLARLSPATGEVRRFRHDPTRPEGLSADGVTAIVEDRRARLWIGTYGGGLLRLDPDAGRFKHFRHDPADPTSLSGDRVSGVAEAPDGRLWVATMEKGLDVFDPRSGQFRAFRHRPGDAGSLGSDVVHTVFVDGEGTVWAGTHSGLTRLGAGTEPALRTYTTRDGLPSDVVYGVRADAQGRLWLSTNNGLSRFDVTREEFTNYAVSDGLQGSEYNFGAFYDSPGGELFFGGLNGFNAFSPEALRDTSVVPAVVLTGLTVGHRPLGGPPEEARRVKLGFRDKVLGLEFAALDYAAPHRNRFAYKMEGFDPDWVPLTGRRTATYTNLSPGRYTFRLRAANSAGRWNEEGLTLPVEVAAAPWATPWAYAAYVLLLIGGVAGVASIQQRKFHREAEYARALEQRVQERTRELSERQNELEHANQELAQASLTDSLTGLANRRFLSEYLEKETALLHRRYRKQDGPKPAADQLDLAFVMIDLDQFKMINDSAGHAAGDAVLRQLREVLRSVSRNSDLAVRWGGDEFLLVARELSVEGLIELVERIRTRIGEHVFDIGEGRVVRTTASLGFASYPFFREQLDALSWEQVISVADRALYVAKASGRNAWVGFQPGIAALPIQGLFGAICNGPQQLVRDGTLRVTSSLTGVRSLAWEPSREAALR